MLGGYASTAITALTAQNTQGVFGVHPVPPAFVAQQIELVLADIGADAIKTGMLPDAEIIEVVASSLRRAARDLPTRDGTRTIPVVVDPVMVAKGGARLMNDDAKDALVRELFPLCAIVTPNGPEAEALTGHPVTDTSGQIAAARALIELGARAALVKGGHVEGPEVVDVLVQRGEAPVLLRHPRMRTTSTHGTGCTLASAIAAGLARGDDLESAVRAAVRYVARAIATAPGLGRGHGPLNHGWPLDETAGR